MEALKTARSMSRSLGILFIIAGLACYAWLLRVGDALTARHPGRVERAT